MKNKLWFLLILFIIPFKVFAEDETLTSKCNITVGGNTFSKLTDDNYLTASAFTSNDQILISCPENINSIYIMYDVNSATGSANGVPVGNNGFLHELVKLDTPSKEVTISYNTDYAIGEIYALGSNVPAWVEDWQILEKADLMLMSSHADDEQLFFAGLMPKYVSEGKKIQVVYFTNHNNAPRRCHEQLEGLWTVGVHYYPVIGPFPDAWAETFEGAVTQLEKAGYTYDDAVKYEVINIRKYKPDVIVGHDEAGEYSHGQHILNTHALEEAIIKAYDENYDPDSYNLYGAYEPSKVYLHLYNQKQIVMDYDVPLEMFGGKTAFQVSQDGFSKHYSQDWTWFVEWIYGANNEITSATQIKTYNPAYFGLYYSSVGDDTPGVNDMFENIIDPIDLEEDSPKEVAEKVVKKVKQEIKKNPKKIYLYLGIGLISFSFIGTMLFVIKHKK